MLLNIFRFYTRGAPTQETAGKIVLLRKALKENFLLPRCSRSQFFEEAVLELCPGFLSPFVISHLEYNAKLSQDLNLSFSATIGSK